MPENQVTRCFNDCSSQTPEGNSRCLRNWSLFFLYIFSIYIQYTRTRDPRLADRCMTWSWSQVCIHSFQCGGMVKNVGTSRILWQCIQQALVRVLKNAVFFSVIMALSHNSLAGAVSLSITKKLRVWQSCYLRGSWSACVSFICHIECMLHTVSHTNYNQLTGATFSSTNLDDCGPLGHDEIVKVW